MDDIELAIHQAWRQIKPRLLKDRKELKRRVARGQSRSFSRPPRVWCLAIRASDRRIAEYQQRPEPVEGSDPPQTEDEEQIYVDGHMLHDLCRPVTIPRGGDIWDEVARHLGVGFTGLHGARLSGRLKSHYVAHLSGRVGPPVPILYAEEELDPNARGFARPDVAWGWTGGTTGAYSRQRIPDDLEARLLRVPIHRPIVAARHYDDTLHPEVRDSPRSSPRQRLPAPPPDYVWYKWSKSGEYLGDDPRYWRKSFQDPGTPPPPQPPKSKRRRKPRARSPSGSLVFGGWRWICPRCGKRVKVLYLPMRRVNLLCDELPVVGCQLPVESRPESVLATNNWQLATFACYSCHRVRSFSRIDRKNSWNELVGYLSGGLLYGREVPKPDWYERDAARKQLFRPRANRPAPRRQQVLRRMLNGWTIMQIAADLKMSKQQVCDSIRRLCRQENVRNRRELALKLGSPHAQPMDSDRVEAAAARRERVREMLRMGMSHRQIIAAVGSNVSIMEQDVNVIHKSDGVRRRNDLCQNMQRG